MILLFFLLISILRADAGFINTPNPHLSDILRLKCDALPYRTAFDGIRCYVAVNKEVAYGEAPAQCSTIFAGSKVATQVPTDIFNAMMIDASKYHNGKDDGKKQTICVYDNGYECDGTTQQSTVMPGKCVHRSAHRMQYTPVLWADSLLAETYCSSRGMELASIGNERENKMIRGVLENNPAWVKITYELHKRGHKWKREKAFGKYGTCLKPGKVTRTAQGFTAKCCGWMTMAVIIDPTGYWTLDGMWDASTYAVCVKNAENDFTRDKTTCIKHHEWDEETGKCEWVDQKDSCLQLIDFKNLTWFMPMPNFPKQTYRMVDLVVTGNTQNDNAVKVIVRQGCMFSGYDIRNSRTPSEIEASLGDNLGYGQHRIPSIHNGDLANAHYGLSGVECFCDPTQATLNDHIPSPPPKKKCIEHHVFNEATQACEWNEDPKYCAELITHDGRRQMLEIPNWPKNKKYDVDHWNNATKKAENFHVTVTEIIVRQHCWATVMWGTASRLAATEKKTIETNGYGKHQVASHYNGLVKREQDGMKRVVCRCIR